MQILIYQGAENSQNLCPTERFNTRWLNLETRTLFFEFIKAPDQFWLLQ